MQHNDCEQRVHKAGNRRGREEGSCGGHLFGVRGGHDRRFLPHPRPVDLVWAGKLESTVRYLGIDVDDALEIAEQ
jgi:hypothetical protein